MDNKAFQQQASVCCGAVFGLLHLQQDIIYVWLPIHSFGNMPCVHVGSSLTSCADLGFFAVHRHLQLV